MRIKNETTVKSAVEAGGPLIVETLGNLDEKINQFSSLDGAEPGSLGFIVHPKYLETAEESGLSCVIAPVKLKETVETLSSQKTWLFSPNPELAAREIKKNLVFPTPYRAPISGVHATAVIHESAKLASDVIVGPHAVIGANVTLGSGTFVGANSIIEENTNIGNNVTIHPLVYIGHSTEIGNHCEIMPQATIASEGFGYAHDHLGNHYRIPHTGRVILEDDVHIGAGTAIDRGTIKDSKIGKGTKIDNQCHLAHNSVVGKNGLITAQLVTAGSTTIGDNFMCGGKTAIAGHINITDNVNVAALSGIANNVKEPGAYGGYPLQPLKQFLKIKSSSVHLPEFRKQMNRVLRKLFPEDYQ